MSGARSWWTRDHPRSRGVYLETKVDTVKHYRIIPARAGFTVSAPADTENHRDHPRSRGVYSAVITREAPEQGSSPLARGLLVGESPDDPRAGIIPARAGFTGIDVGVDVCAGDHPRSRGVYGSPNRPTVSR